MAAGGVGDMMRGMKSAVPIILFGAWVVESVVLAVGPVSRATWWAENITVWVVVTPVVWLYVKGIRFSNTAYVLMSVLVFLHTIGGHYTFAEVPFGWVTDWLGAQRNHFDRLAHFTVGFWIFPILEFVEGRGLSRNRAFSLVFGLAAILAVAALFEMVEWLYAVLADPTAGTAFLGSQGDVWDAQKDMLADGLGAVAAGALYHMLRPQMPNAV